MAARGTSARGPGRMRPRRARARSSTSPSIALLSGTARRSARWRRSDALHGHDDPAWGATAEPPLDAEAWWVRGERARLRAALLRRDALRDGTVSAAEFVAALSEPNYQPDRAASAGFAPGWD